MKQESVNIQKKPWEIEGVEWREVKVKEFVEEVKSGFALSKQKRRKIDANNGIPQLRPYNIANWNKINLDDLTYIPKSMTGIEEYFIKNKEVLFNNTNSIELVGRAAVYRELNGNYTYSNHITKIRVKEQIIIPDFLSWYLNYLWSKGFFYLKATKWIGQAGISNKKLLSIKFPLPFRNSKPDLETQKKIVEYIETSFSKINSILEKKKIILSHLDELWESILENAFKPREGEEWREVEFLNMVNLIKGSKPKKVFKEKQDNTLPYLTTKYFREKVIKEFIPIKENKLTFINKGDLVIIADGSRSGELFFCDREGVLVSTMAKLEIKKREIYKKYLFWFLTIHFEQLNKSKYTATPHVNKNHLKKLKLPLPFRNGKPDLERQKEIAEYLDRVYEKIKSIKEKVQSQINQLEDMKESIFNEVFSHDKVK